MNNENKEKTTSSTEQITNSSKASTVEKIVRQARQQQAEFEQERLDWELKEQNKAKEDLELLRQNSHLKKEIGEIKRQIESLKVKSVLERETELNNTDEIKLTPDQKVKQVLAQVIADMRKEAQETRAKKTDNTFYL